MTHSAARPNEASAAGAHTGPSPTRDNTRVSTDVQNPRLQAAVTNDSFVGPSGRLLARIATNKTANPMTLARIKAKNAAVLRHAGGANRGFERDHRTQPQISAGIGKRYPAKPMRPTRASMVFPLVARVSRSAMRFASPDSCVLLITRAHRKPARYHDAHRVAALHERMLRLPIPPRP